jgi:hypothetical protein
MTADIKIVVGLAAIGVLVLIGDSRVHYRRALERLREEADSRPPVPGWMTDPRLDGNVVRGVDAGLAIAGSPLDEFTMLWGG